MFFPYPLIAYAFVLATVCLLLGLMGSVLLRTAATGHPARLARALASVQPGADVAAAFGLLLLVFALPIVTLFTLLVAFVVLLAVSYTPEATTKRMLRALRCLASVVVLAVLAMQWTVTFATEYATPAGTLLVVLGCNSMNALLWLAARYADNHVDKPVLA